MVACRTLVVGVAFSACMVIALGAGFSGQTSGQPEQTGRLSSIVQVENRAGDDMVLLTRMSRFSSEASVAGSHDRETRVESDPASRQSSNELTLPGGVGVDPRNHGVGVVDIEIVSVSPGTESPLTVAVVDGLDVMLE